MTRREWLGTAAGSLFCSYSSAAPDNKITVAAHAWVYAAPLPGYDYTPALERIFSDLSYAGLDALELMEKALRHDDAVARIGELSAKFDLPIIGTSYDGVAMWDRSKHSEIVEDAGVVLSRVAKLKGRTLGVSVGDAGRKKTEDELDAQASVLRQVRKVAEEHSIVVNLHNHIYEVKDGEYDLNGTLKRIPDAKLGPDLDWLTGAGINPVDFLRRHRTRIVYLHLRDRKSDGTWSEAMGEGAIDYRAIGRTLKEINFTGDVAIELAHPKDFQLTRPLRESWKMSREYVRRTMGL